MAEKQTANPNEGQPTPTPEGSEPTGTATQQEQQEAPAEEQSEAEEAGEQKKPTTLNEAKAAEGKEDEGGEEQSEADESESKSDDEPAAERKAPDEYEITSPLKNEDGEALDLDRDVLSAFLNGARDISLPNDEAQKLIDAVVPALQVQSAKAIAAAHRQMEVDLQADPDLGGEKLAETLRTANRFVDAYDKADEVRDLLDATGLGGHRVFVGLFNWAGAKITPETKIVRGEGGGEDPRSRDPVDRLAESYETASD